MTHQERKYDERYLSSDFLVFFLSKIFLENFRNFFFEKCEMKFFFEMIILIKILLVNKIEKRKKA